ncbi:MAG TPA: pyridoxal phosphate-dependent aminotransferase [Acidimicrobiales bacterium]|nr:pyridoxal phosphate-dependent aminotransferase [Acidimicrobiales bacterium]
MTDATTEARIAARIAAIPPSATLAITAKAKALKAAGEPVIVFGAGEPDFATPDHIVEAAVVACRDPQNHHYTPAAGLPELRAAVAAKTRRDSGYEVEPEQVLITNGGKHAISNAFNALIDPGDEVLLPAPYWTTYPEPVRFAGGVVVELPTTAVMGFKVTVEQLEAARTPRTKVLVFVSPSNPTGVVYAPDEVVAIGRWAAEHGIWVLTDEIYEHLTYSDHVFTSIATAVPELGDKVVIVNGVAKTYAMTGWRVGWMIGPVDVVKAAANLQSHQTSNVSNVAQRAALAAVSGPLDAVAEMRTAFDRRGRKMVELLRGIAGVEVLDPQGAFYAFPSFEGVLGRTIAGRKVATTLDLAAVILDEVKVAIVPGEAFAAPGYARLSTALGDDDLVEGVTRIAELLG